MGEPRFTPEVRNEAWASNITSDAQVKRGMKNRGKHWRWHSGESRGG